MEFKEKKQKYDLKLINCSSLVIPNKEMKELIKKDIDIQRLMCHIFYNLELDNNIVRKVLVSPEMNKTLKNKIEFWMGGYLWTAKIITIKDLEEIIFICDPRKGKI